MNIVAPTDDELSEAYKAAELRRIGVSFQKAVETESIRIALKLTAIAMRNKTTSDAAPDREFSPQQSIQF